MYCKSYVNFHELALICSLWHKY